MRTRKAEGVDRGGRGRGETTEEILVEINRLMYVVHKVPYVYDIN